MTLGGQSGSYRAHHLEQRPPLTHHVSAAQAASLFTAFIWYSLASPSAARVFGGASGSDSAGAKPPPNNPPTRAPTRAPTRDNDNADLVKAVVRSCGRGGALWSSRITQARGHCHDGRRGALWARESRSQGDAAMTAARKYSINYAAISNSIISSYYFFVYSVSQTSFLFITENG